jgi:hypothetical protein
MYRVFLLWLALAAPAMGSVMDSQIFINEFHYDNVGADEQEFVEVVAPESWSDLSSVHFMLYNGSTGASYSSATPLSDFTKRDVVDGYAFYTYDVSMQNGAPDGLALAWGDQVLQFLSYEGTFTAADGIAEGLLSTDVGVLETTSTPIGFSLQLSGTGDSYSDFTWQAPGANTYGGINEGQLFAVPEPSSLLLWCCAGSAAALGCWRRRHR